jgi:hypothetical protein
MDHDQEEDEENQPVFDHLLAMSEYIKRETNASSVQIVITRKHEQGGFASFAHGTGNFYERIGAVKTWLDRQ